MAAESREETIYDGQEFFHTQRETMNGAHKHAKHDPCFSACRLVSDRSFFLLFSSCYATNPHTNTGCCHLSFATRSSLWSFMALSLDFRSVRVTHLACPLSCAILHLCPPPMPSPSFHPPSLTENLHQPPFLIPFALSNPRL